MNLDDIRIATPCPASWADMEGDERKRLCALCKLHVYNFAEMTRPEVEALVSGGTDRTCVRMYRRKDGTILLKDCPVGLRAASRRFFATMAASLAVLFGALLWGMNELRDGDHFDWGRLAKVQPFKAIASLIHKLSPEPAPEPFEYIAGKIALPPPRVRRRGSRARMNIDELRIATPCTASWADMEGDERKRFCGLCKLNVYNFSAMTRVEIDALVTQAEGRVCGRFYRRKDGTILTKDCPVGLRAATRRFFATMGASLAVLFGALLWGMTELRDGDHFDWARLAKVQPFKAIALLIHRVDPVVRPTPTPMPMGSVAYPLPTPKAKR